ncbi:hypothetical protein ACFOYW_12225 [Gryllotalpicola reticulitermitis]|uniref:Uncharacterized protein n=1 Tax=Gryllotalpicola reticulitermitis TaxID=1184153 RepID=A0ABV8Q806_9MICO
MTPLIVAAIVAAVCLLLWGLHRLGVVDFSDKTQKRGSGSVGSGMLGAALDEVFHPVRYEAQQELGRQSRLPAPAPEADGDPLGIGQAGDPRPGHIVIELDEWGHTAGAAPSSSKTSVLKR